MERAEGIDSDATGLSPSELQERVIYALLMPAVRMARTFDFPLRQMGDSLQMAYFQELRGVGFKMRQAASILDVSMRKVALLSKRLKENFLRPEQEVGLPRRIEFLLWGEPLSGVRVKKALSGIEPEAIDAALEQLVAEGRIQQRQRRRTDVYERCHSQSRLVSEDWHFRIDALNNLLENVCHAVYGRFFANDAKAFARTVSFQIREKDIGKLQELYQNVIWERIKELEVEAKDQPDAMSLDLSMCWAPYQYLETQNESGKNSD